MESRDAMTSCASQVSALAKKRDYGEGVRVFKAAAARLSPTPIDKVAVQFHKLGGEAAHRALVKCFALAPCYCCERGRMTCEQCEGADTITANGRYCEECGGTGYTPCTFCGGSGFLSFDAIPANLVEAVAGQRLKWAGRLLRGVAKHSARLKHIKATQDISTDLFDLLHQTERIDAVIENSEPILNHDGSAERQSTRYAELSKLADDCRQLNARYQTHLTSAVVRQCEARVVESPPESKARMIWQRRMEFYTSLGSEHSVDDQNDGEDEHRGDGDVD